ncbi:MAG: c-type cytochrome [Terriglobales bacterium]
MPVRSTNIASTLGFLLAGWLSAAFLPCMLGGPHLASAQEAKRSQEAAKTSNNAKLIAQGKYIVEGVAGCGYCHTPRDKNGDPDRTRWLAGAPVFYEPARPVAGWPLTAPRLAGLPPGTDAEIITLLTTSVTRDGTPPRAPMPRFHMTRADAEAVLAYLKSLPSPQGSE